MRKSSFRPNLTDLEKTANLREITLKKFKRIYSKRMSNRGGQPGNNNAGRGQQARQALELAIANNGEDKEVVSGLQILYNIWRVQVLKAMEGDQAATNAIMDRLDGKPGQAIMLTGDENNPIAIHRVERVIVKPTNSNG